MSRFYSYLNTAQALIEAYQGDQPFAPYLKQFFSLNKKYGSRDRKLIASICYDYWRIGFAAPALAAHDRLLLAYFLCEREPSEMLDAIKPTWSKKISYSLNRKLSWLSTQFAVTDIFPFCDELSEQVEPVEFCSSFLVQPDVFIRVRPKARAIVPRKLKRAKLAWKPAGPDCIRLGAAENLEEVFILNKEVVVQDFNSQRVLDFLKPARTRAQFLSADPKLGPSVWDCCAASGGKSILLYDILNKKMQLTVSDIRPRIVLMLHQRFKKAGIKEYQYFISDVSNAMFSPGEFNFDLVICDAPCTGSGTWSRTPEQLSFFKKEMLDAQVELQKKIVSSVWQHVKPGGLLVYITCSVFRRENEGIAHFIETGLNGKRLFTELLPGYDKKADTLFVAVFQQDHGNAEVDAR